MVTLPAAKVPVSYTHLDVYKRQDHATWVCDADLRCPDDVEDGPIEQGPTQQLFPAHYLRDVVHPLQSDRLCLPGLGWNRSKFVIPYPRKFGRTVQEMQDRAAHPAHRRYGKFVAAADLGEVCL